MIRLLSFILLALNLLAEAPHLAEYNRAWLLRNNGHYSEAIAAAKTIIAEDPIYYRAYALIARASIEASAPEDAQTFFEGLATVDRANPWPYYALGRLALDRGKQSDARKAFGECINRSVHAWSCYAKLGELSKTDSGLRSSLPRNADPLGTILAQSYFRRESRRFDDSELARKGLELARQRNDLELQAAFDELIGLSYWSMNRDYGRGLVNFESAYAVWNRLDDWESEERVALEKVGVLTESRQFIEAQRWIDSFEASAYDHLGLMTQATLCFLEGNIQMALGHLNQALALKLKNLALLESVHLPIDRALLHIGGIYAANGEYDRARVYMQRSYALAKGDFDRAFVLRSLGVLSGDQGDYAQALQLGWQSVNLFDRLGKPWQAGAGRGNLAATYAILGDFDEATSLLQKALASARQQNDSGEIQGSLANLGDLYMQMGDPASALTYLKQAEILSAHTSYESARVDTLLHIATAYRAQGHLDLAVSYANKAVAAARATISRSQEAQTRIELASIQLSSGAARKAEQNFLTALDLAETAAAPQEIIAAHRGLADVSIRAGRFSNAASHLKLAVNRLEALRSSAPGPELRASFLSQNWRVYEDLAYVLVTLHDDREAFDYVERGRSRALLDVLARAGSSNPKLHHRPMNLSEVEEQVRQRNTVLMDYLLGEKESYLWAISPKGSQMFRLPGRQQLVANVQSFRQAIATPHSTADYKGTGRALYDTLWSPAETFLKSGRGVVVIPDGELNYLPFEALIDRSGRFSVETFAIAYAWSPSTLNLLKRDRTRDARLEFVGFGAPALEENTASASEQSLRGIYQRAGFRFPPLPYAREELTQIAALFPAGKSQLFIGVEATKSAVRTARLSDYKRLHFATHTVFDESSPERTGIVLTPAANDDGILRAHDILKLHLDADLVVLSACQTGLGKLLRGEGITGLSQAFLFAGARRIVVSSWEVNDLATSELMTQFYRALANNASPAEALQQAKVQLLRSGSPAYRHPYFWASFVTIGNL